MANFFNISKWCWKYYLLEGRYKNQNLLPSHPFSKKKIRKCQKQLMAITPLEPCEEKSSKWKLLLQHWKIIKPWGYKNRSYPQKFSHMETKSTKCSKNFELSEKFAS
jgi:hypothetical protein